VARPVAQFLPTRRIFSVTPEPRRRLYPDRAPLVTQSGYLRILTVERKLQLLLQPSHFEGLELSACQPPIKEDSDGNNGALPLLRIRS